MIWAAVRPTLCLVLAAAGCTAAPEGDGNANAAPQLLAPADFSLDVTVRSGPAPEEPGDAPDPGISLRQAHYVLFCDGSLHWAGGPVAPNQALPPLTRVLDRQEMAELWQLLQRLGYADPAAGAAPVNAKLVEVPSGEVHALSVITGNGARWARADRRPAGAAPDAAMVELVEHLAGLVWSSAWADPPEDAARRLEFGPDPYARYRRP
jgi:hypothetical protein